MSGFFPSMCNFKTFEAHLNMLKLSLKLSGSRGASASNSDTSHRVSQAASTLQSSSRSSLHHAARGSALCRRKKSESNIRKSFEMWPEGQHWCTSTAVSPRHPRARCAAVGTQSCSPTHPASSQPQGSHSFVSTSSALRSYGWKTFLQPLCIRSA